MDNRLIFYPIFKPHKNLVAFTTVKKTFAHPAPRFTGDTPEIFIENREQLASILEINPSQLVFPRQTHTSCVAKLSEKPKKEIKETDALLTNRKNICLCVQTADCVPVLLFDPVENVISAIHAGWRGTVNKIVEVAVQKMQANYKSKPENILAVIGPSIGPEVYEVGREVVEAAQKNIPQSEKTLHKNLNGKFHFNLWEANRLLLLCHGLKTKNISIAEECTFTKTEKYFSARKEGVDTGRIVTGIMLI
ncbi:peptidoglycan editing factor PgeF [Maribellus comscasis]|uniref:Purine nucleoside phosphorylase n=1 Tax=Maribellus comscasis TaxID=2681766 RepID=A0A6I6JRT6_9BACT|nr:peptidoglycan editing factor PgeF [Maribellus comscasis]QGY43939.1 peptidoglycan editing factor PgeF [Maribellus comscasis]